MSAGFWNGEPAEVRRCVVIVAPDPERRRLCWHNPFVGQERHAVEVRYNDRTFYLDDEGHERSDEERAYLQELAERCKGERKFDMAANTITSALESDRIGSPGWGWRKVREGHGSPRFGHASLAVERVVRYLQDHEEPS